MIGSGNMAILLGGRGGIMTENLQNRAKIKIYAPAFVYIDRAVDMSIYTTWKAM